MRLIRRFAVIGAAVALLMGAGVGVASAKANGSAYLADGTELAFHASGTETKNSGGFELSGSPLGYISGKVVCYTEGDDTAAFTAKITKATNKSYIDNETFITFYLVDGTTDQFGYVLGEATCMGDAQNLQDVVGDSYITIK